MVTDKITGILAEFHKYPSKRLRLFSVYVLSEGMSYEGKQIRYVDGYDVEWSKAYQSYIFHNSSSGIMPKKISGIYYISGDMKVKEKPCDLVDVRDKAPWKGKKTRIIRERNRTRRLKRLPKAFDMDGVSNLLEWLQANGIEEDAVYCSECRDWLPTDQDEPCDHCWWCANTATWSTPDERCSCKDRDECDIREKLTA